MRVLLSYVTVASVKIGEGINRRGFHSVSFVNCESETGNPLDKVQIIKIL